MKKLLFSLGTVAAIVAPVAAVVACGKKDDKAATQTIADKTAFVNLAKDKGYTVTFATDSKIAELFKSSTQVLVKNGALAEANDEDKSHGTNDYAIVVKGTPIDKSSVEAQSNKSSFVVDGVTYGSVDMKMTIDEINGSSTTKGSSLIERWGLTINDLQDAKAIIYLQTDDKNVMKIGLDNVVKLKDGKVYVVDQTVSDTVTPITPANS